MGTVAFSGGDTSLGPAGAAGPWRDQPRPSSPHVTLSRAMSCRTLTSPTPGLGTAFLPPDLLLLSSSKPLVPQPVQASTGPSGTSPDSAELCPFVPHSFSPGPKGAAEPCVHPASSRMSDTSDAWVRTSLCRHQGHHFLPSLSARHKRPLGTGTHSPGWRCCSEPAGLPLAGASLGCFSSLFSRSEGDDGLQGGAHRD